MATSIGLFIITQANGYWNIVGHTLTDKSLTAVLASGGVILAGTAEGIWRSSDNGRSWKCIYRCYIRAAWVDPQDAQHIIAGPADGVSRNGRIEETHDGGRSWQPASVGINSPWPRHMVERFYQHDKNLFAILSNGELWTRSSGHTVWQRILPEVSGIQAMAASN